MVKKEIIWSKLAKLQFKAILEYYVERNGNENYSLKLVDEVEDVLNTLSKSELIGRLTLYCPKIVDKFLGYKFRLIYVFSYLICRTYKLRFPIDVLGQGFGSLGLNVNVCCCIVLLLF